MSYDVFVARPGTRIVRIKDLLAYCNAELEADLDDESGEGAILPAISQFAVELARVWPPTNSGGPFADVDADPDNDRLADYGFHPTSLYLGFRWSQQTDAHDKVRALALRHNLLFFNTSGWDWINAVRDPERGRPGTLYLSEPDEARPAANWSGAANWIEPGDADLLTAPEGFKPKSHFGFQFADQHFMQTYNSGPHYVVEYRQGSADGHYQALTKSIEKIRESFNLYYRDDPLAFKVFDYKKVRV